MNVGDVKRAEGTTYTTVNADLSLISPSDIDSHNNFLASPAIFATNIKGKNV